MAEGEAEFSRETSVLQNQVELSDIGGTYQRVRELGAGENDVAYLVADSEGITSVALSPANPFQFDDVAWRMTEQKVAKVSLLDKLGLQEHAVHEIARGILPPRKENYPSEKAVIVEYGGEPISTAQTGGDKLEILRQIWHVTRTIHDHGYAIHDFQLDIPL